jgi:elongation factor Ts
MANVTTQDIQKLREASGAGMMDAKKALVEAEGDFEKAIDLLRKRGAKVAASKGSRTTNQGLVEAYIHGEGGLGVLVELACETDFVARTDTFKALAHDLAMQVAASSPQYVESSQVPAEVVAREKAVYVEQLKEQGKEGAMVEKIVEGKLEKFYQEVCLMKQPFFKDDSKTVGEVVVEAIATLGENIKVRRFARFSLTGGSAVWAG